MSNTRRFNARAQALRAQHTRISQPNHRARVRGPAHGLLGDSYSQAQASKAGRTPTVSLRPSQQIKIRRKGAAAAAKIAPSQLQNTFEGPSSSTRADSPPSFNEMNIDQGDHWEDSEEEEEGVDEMDQAQQELQTEYRDFRKRRSRTDTSNSYWDQQMEELIDAYLDWSLKKHKGEENVASGQELLRLEVIDVFGMSFPSLRFSIKRLTGNSRIRTQIYPCD